MDRRFGCAIIPVDMLPISADILSSLEPNSAYVVGGSVRDMLLARRPLDYDLAVTGSPEQFARQMAAALSGHYVEIGKPGLMIHRVVSGDLMFDISAIAGTSIEDDLRRRDFTINAMAYDLSGGNIVDCLNGRQDLDKKTVRMVSPSVFKQDPVRLIRAFRMAATLNFTVDQETEAAVEKNAFRIRDSAGERIWAELYKILDTDDSHRFVDRMAGCGLLFAILPELLPLKGCLQNRYHQFDVFDHTLAAYDHLEQILLDARTYIPATTENRSPLSVGIPAPILKFALLLHDIGKPPSRSEGQNGRVHFYGHGRKGADMARGISRRLKLSRRDADDVDFIVRNHLRPLHLFTSRRRDRISPKAVTRFFIRAGTRTPALLLHSIADILGKKMTDDDRNQEFTGFARQLMVTYFSSFKPRTHDPPLLSGHDLINTFELRPSPLLGTILARTEEARLAGVIGSKKEAEKWVQNFLKTRRSLNPDN